MEGCNMTASPTNFAGSGNKDIQGYSFVNQHGGSRITLSGHSGQVKVGILCVISVMDVWHRNHDQLIIFGKKWIVIV